MMVAFNDRTQQAEPFFAVVIGNGDSKQISLPLCLATPGINKSTTYFAELGLLMEAAFDDGGKINAILGKLQHQQGLEINDISLKISFFGLFREQSGSWKDGDTFRGELECADVDGGQIVDANQSTQYLQAQDEHLLLHFGALLALEPT